MKTKTKVIAAALALLLVITVGAGFWLMQKQDQSYQGPVEQISVAAGKTGVLVYIAQEQGYFAQNGLEVTINNFDAGKLAADAMLAGEADIATASASVLVSRSFEYEDIRAFGSIATFRIQELIARSDHGIAQIDDLSGKTIGVTVGSNGEAALGRFLILNGLAFQDVEIIDLKPQEIEEAMIKGEIDAALAWEPYVYNIKQALEGALVSWPGDSDQDSIFILLTKDEWINAHRPAIERFLTALLQAEQYVRENDDEARLFIRQLFDYDPDYLETVWPKFTYTVGLSQTLILAMEDEARWRIENGLTDQNQVPNYLNFLYLEALEEVNPESVTVIR